VDVIEDLESALANAAAAIEPPAPDGERLARAAREAGLEDVAYTTEASPVGELLLARTPRGLAMVSYVDPFPLDESLEALARRISPRVIEDPAALDDVRRQLDEYFRRRRHDFEIPLDWSMARGFGRRVLAHTARIPYGAVETYGEVARAIGAPRAARATGNALGANPMAIVVPCHRVVRAGGVIGQYTGGAERKVQLLELEGR
jgi:methylated-DNA-[protein]-cysteine S-methyltransferase